LAVLELPVVLNSSAPKPVAVFSLPVVLRKAYQVQGVPTSRIIVGRREIEYPNGLMFEKNRVVGVKPR
jgi:hypothetical protein